KGDALQVEVRKKTGKLSGRVQDENGNPISGVAINVAGLSTMTDSSGHFEFVIPGDRMQRELGLEALAPGYAPATFNNVVPNANPLTISLNVRTNHMVCRLISVAIFVFVALRVD